MEDCLDYEQPTDYIVSSTAYCDSYQTPVLTAGKTFVLGFTNEKNGIFEADKNPVIIFDDFTTATKFVDFPFKVKSSAMKILKNKNIKLHNTRFLYEAMQQIKFTLGEEHKRFWISEYSKLKMELPSFDEQQKIADFISSLDDLIKAKEEQVVCAETWKKGLLQKMFV